jgi:hypothetical protein
LPKHLPSNDSWYAVQLYLNFVSLPPTALQLLVASTSKKPSDGDLQKILAPTAAKMADIEKCKDNRSEVKEHLNTIAEGAGDAAH